MIKPWVFAPVVAFSAVIGSFFWWQVEKDRWVPPAPRRPELPMVALMPPPARVDAKQALDQPLFWVSRRPIEVGEKKNGAADELAQARLTAVFESGAARIAVLQRSDGTTLKITNETKPWQMESFDGHKAIFLSADDQRVEKYLEASPTAATKSGNTTLDLPRKPLIAQ